MKYRYIFFDVGNTLVVSESCSASFHRCRQESHPTLEGWQALERRTKNEFDQGLITGKIDHGFWWTFHTHLLNELASSMKVFATNW